jgi:menaquinone-dependent protoporphyrinogen IX oxidase
VAEGIGKSLSGNGTLVDIRPVEEDVNLDGYQNVIVGSAIQSGQWLPEALQFVLSYRAELSRKPFAAFLVCMTLAMPGAEKNQAGVSDWLGPARALVKPVSEGLFRCALDLKKIPSLGDRMKFGLSIALGS